MKGLGAATMVVGLVLIGAWWLWPRQQRPPILAQKPLETPVELLSQPASTVAESDQSELASISLQQPDAILDAIADRYRVGQPTRLTAGQIPPDIPTATRSDGPAVAATMDAFESGQHPERLSPTVLPEAFDRQAYQSDPDSFLNLAVPGRVFQSQQPGPDVTQLAAVVPRRMTIRQGESVRLAVRARQGWPVTFTSFDLGYFGNRLVTQTVAANEDSVAEVDFTGGVGTVGDVQILAGSPVHSGRVRFVVHVLEEGQQGE